uniref:lysophospholipid acyltransferase 7-like isoform X1 n=2 Tax=Myxine glutinosa TaxID=7769 RepID=UPI00358F3FB4
MSPEEWGYLLVLLASLPGGFFIKTLEGQSLRCAVPALLGAGLALLLCGVNSLHSVVVTAGTCLIVHATHRHCHMLTLLWTFSYLAFFRTCHLLGLPSPPAYANAMQLILTLKLVSLANEVRDLSLLQKVEDKAVGRPSTVLALRRMPTIWEMWCYCYCYVGLLTGPFYRFRTFDDWVNQPHSVSIPTWRPLLQRVRYAPVFGVLFLISARFFPANAALSDEFYESGFAFRLFYMVPVFFAFRMRFYVCWLLAEAGCIAAALGAYPKRARAKPGAGPIMELESTSSEAEGPVEYDFDTIKNIDCYSADFCVRVKDGMRYWNMSVQWWLAQYIYKTAPFRPYILRVLPQLPHHPAVPRRRECHGEGRTGPASHAPPRGLRLGALVPEDACLRLHVHGLCAAVSARHAALLALHRFRHACRALGVCGFRVAAACLARIIAQGLRHSFFYLQTPLHASSKRCLISVCLVLSCGKGGWFRMYETFSMLTRLWPKPL